MNAILVMLLGLIGRKQTIDQIVSPMNKILSNLEAHNQRQKLLADKHHAKSLIARAKASNAEAEAANAARLADNYRGFIKPVA